MFKKILVANRGEIAVRIIRACKELNIPSVAVHSDVDADSMHVRLADESICIGSHKPQNSYLNIGAIMSAVDVTGADAVHPGYGFLSENSHFAEIVTKSKIKFIGPSAEIMKKMGDKIEAKKTAKKLGLPIIEGSEGNVTSTEEAKKIASKIGFPILIKASAGGGGKGMKLVKNEKEIDKEVSLINSREEHALKPLKKTGKTSFLVKEMQQLLERLQIEKGIHAELARTRREVIEKELELKTTQARLNEILALIPSKKQKEKEEDTKPKENPKKRPAEGGKAKKSNQTEDPPMKKETSARAKRKAEKRAFIERELKRMDDKIAEIQSSGKEPAGGKVEDAPRKKIKHNLPKALKPPGLKGTADTEGYV